MDSTRETVAPASHERLWVSEEDGLMRRGDQLYVRPDGVVPAFSPENALNIMEGYQRRGKLPLLRWKLAQKGVPLIERACNPNYDRRLRALRDYVEQADRVTTG